MLRSIATLTLLVAHAAAWVGGPQFDCVDSHGSICVDGGPRSCHCCKEDEGSAATAHHCDGHGHGDRTVCNELAFSAGDCDCSHELITTRRTFNFSRGTSSTTLHEAWQTAAPFAIANDALFACRISVHVAADSAAHLAPPLILLSPVALRC